MRVEEVAYDRGDEDGHTGRGHRGRPRNRSATLWRRSPRPSACSSAFLDFYAPAKGYEGIEEAVKGFKTPYGLIILIVAGLCFVFATSVMFAKFFDKDFWLARSPGWLYMGAAGVILVISIMAMIFPYKGSPEFTTEYISMVGTFFTGLFIAFGGLLKF